MPAPITCTITYQGTILAAQITSSPWSCIGVAFPGRGGVPYNPQLLAELLQPGNVDGSRMRAGGAHYPQFKMATILGALDFPDAQALARQLELCRSDVIAVDFFGQSFVANCLEVVAYAVAKPVVGGVALPSGTTVANASVETIWDLQVATL